MNRQPNAASGEGTSILVACRNGHLDDFPWVSFVHRGPTGCKAVLRLIEYGAAGEARRFEHRRHVQQRLGFVRAHAFGQQRHDRLRDGEIGATEAAEQPANDNRPIAQP